MPLFQIQNMVFKSGQTLTVKGIPNGNASSRFSVNIGYSQQDIALHVNPRFDSNTVVCNTCQNGVWGPEVIGKGFPFKQGVEFTFTISFQCGEFVITLPGDEIRVPNRLNAKEYPYYFSTGEANIASLEIK